MPEIQASTGVGILFISHNLAVVRYMADVIAVMKGGQLVEHASTDTVIQSPSHPYTRELLAAIPSMT